LSCSSPPSAPVSAADDVVLLGCVVLATDAVMRDFEGVAEEVLDAGEDVTVVYAVSDRLALNEVCASEVVLGVGDGGGVVDVDEVVVGAGAFELVVGECLGFVVVVGCGAGAGPSFLKYHEP
jgi:hypothetical protein